MKFFVCLVLLNSIVLVLFSGCATVTSTGIQKFGPDTYTIRTNTDTFFSLDSIFQAKQKAITEANQFAEKMGKYMIPVKVDEKIVRGEGIYDLTFRLVNKNDPEYQRTNLQKEPDVVVKKDVNIDLR